MQLPELVWGQHPEEEKPVSKNRDRNLQGGDSGSSVIMSRLQLCLEHRREGSASDESLFHLS